MPTGSKGEKRATSNSWIPPAVGDDEHVIRRLGWALIQQWANVPPAVRKIIREQAIYTEDRQKTAHLDQQIDLFIRKHAGGQ